MYTPTQQEFTAAARPGDLVPVYREILADRLTPVAAFETVAAGAGSFLLESVERGERIGRYSFLGARPFLTVKTRGNVVTMSDSSGVTTRELNSGEDPLHVLQDLFAQYRVVTTKGLPRFCGGAVGFLAYDAVRFFENLPDSTDDDVGMEDSCFFFSDSLLIFDHVRRRLQVVCYARVGTDPEADYRAATARIDDLIDQLRHARIPEPEPQRVCEPAVTANVTQQEFEAAVERCREYILAGDAFQVLASMRFKVEMRAPPFQLYRALRSVNPSPYMFYLDMGNKQVVGSSPEILVTVEAGVITLRPIAGTRRRGATPEEDTLLEQELLADEKERAEHIMLVDLGRNDVGRVAEYGSVCVDQLMSIEKYSHVMHISSNVTGKVAAQYTVFDVMRASFPAGTLTGAPKVRAMEIIDELEPTRRGLYGGAVGYFSFNGDMDFCIAIRTALVQDGVAYVQAGAGIVADSRPAAEYEEVQNKARALMTAIRMAEEGLD